MNLWKRKLAAYLHDPPSKTLDIRNHGERSDAAFRQANFVDSEIGEYFKHADHAGAAADRLPFPASQASNLACAFDGVRNAFRHPLSGHTLPFHAEFPSTAFAFDGESSVQPGLSPESLTSFPDESTQWQARFFAHWRLWPAQAAQRDYRFTFLPADTRIPDHTIWTHMQVVSALDGCLDAQNVWRPAFLKFQLGPVQEFIGAARSTRDLWSGSYLLSWLMAAGLKALSKEIGPDAIIYPNLLAQPLFDLHWRDELWTKFSIGDRTVWDSIGWSHRDLLTPNLPNVFLAIVPAHRAKELGVKVTEAIQAEWKNIAKHVWDSCEKAELTASEGNFTEDERKRRFDSQIAQFLSLSWASTDWPESLEDARRLAEDFAPEMPVRQARERIQAVVTMATKHMPDHHRDHRFYTDASKTQLNNTGLAWSLLVAFNGWQLDAVRQIRTFPATGSGGWRIGTFSNKDSLTGREEAVAGGTEWGRRADLAKGHWPALFKKDDWLGAPTLVKRVWHEAYLSKVWRLAATPRDFPMPNTRGIADHKPNEDSDGDAENGSREEPKYFAVLALDGDEIGKWVSGERNPTYATQLAAYDDGSHTLKLGAKPYFERPEFTDFLEKQRLLSPSFHLQFSAALSHFALRCARPIVESYDGRLIYAGGDDVLALLPADTALACAQALRLAFQGSPDLRHPGPSDNSHSHALVAYSGHPGFLVRLDDQGNPDRTRLRLEERFSDDSGRPIPFIVPGPTADCSVGIAIAHFKAPLQDVVRAAHAAAEKRAKTALDRSAVAVTLMKHSGETIEWGAKWDGGLDLLLTLGEALKANQLSNKFPHRWAELLAAYVSQPTPLTQASGAVGGADGFDADAILRIEFEHTLSRQRGSNFPTDSSTREDLKARLRSGLDSYLAALTRARALDPEARLQSCIALCQTAAFTHRISDRSEQP